ncbi:MAG: murein biosynthesis integral membrane protein MurJ [Syntrophomonas sp.]|nr:murein biosynthesis integral membrane protein MurJ [Syntrophomonas sp.]
MRTQNKIIAKAAGIIAFTALISRLLGFARDWFIYTRFGESYYTDAYTVAFSVPDFIYMLLIGGALSSAFIPVFSSYLATDREEDTWKMASVVFNYTMLALIVFIFLAFIYAHPLLYQLAPKLPPYYHNLAVFLTRVMFVQCFFMALNGLALGVLHSFNHFTTPALGGIIYNLGIIVVGVAFMDKIGIVAFAYGVVAGAFLNFLVQLPALLNVGLKYYPSLDYHNEGFRQVAILTIPVLIGLSVTQFNLFVSQYLASGLAQGSITALSLAQRIMQLPLGIFAMSIAMAVFPTLTAQAARGEHEDFKRTLSLGLRGIFFVTLPSTAGLLAIGEPTIRMMFEWKSFTPAHTLATAHALTYYSLGLFAYSSLLVLNRVYYALKDTITPVIVGITTILLNIILSFLLVGPLNHLGLALAYSLSGIFDMLLLTFILRLRLGGIDGRKILSSLGLSLITSAFMYLLVRGTVYLLLSVLSFSTRIDELIAVLAAVLLGVLFYAGVSLALGMEEALMVKNMLARRFPDYWSRLT